MVEQSETPRFPWGALCKGPQQRTQEMMSLPGNRTQENPEPGYPGTTAREDPSQITWYQDVLLFAPAQRPGPQEGSQAECVGLLSSLAQDPRGGLWPFARRNRKETREPQAGPGQLSYPTRATLSPFPVNGDRKFSGCVCLKQDGCAVRSLWTSGIPTPGESRLGGMGRAQAALAA